MATWKQTCDPAPAAIALLLFAAVAVTFNTLGHVHPRSHSTTFHLRLPPSSSISSTTSKIHAWRLAPTVCSQHPQSLSCSPSGHSWLEPGHVFLHGLHACRMLQACTYHKLVFVGDSFIRHLMEAVGLLLTSDYEFGAMLPAGRMAQCQGQGQFEEKVCRNFVNNMVSACNGTVVLHLDSGAWPRLGPQHTHYDAVIWGAGRHPLYGDYKTRYGVHNASAVIRDVFKPFCQDRQGSTRVQHKQALFWVQSHARLTPGQPDEQPQLIRHFNEDVCSYLEKECKVPCIDVHTPSQRLVEQLPADAANMTHDGAHWSRSLNIVFAQEVFRTLLESCE